MNPQPQAAEGPLFFRIGAVLAASLAILSVIAFAVLPSLVSSRGAPLIAAAAPETTSSQALPDRVVCADFGRSDLRSPAEGVWYQGSCAPVALLQPQAATTGCNRTSMDQDEFTEVAPGLYAFRPAPESPAYLWYASSDSCFSLVTARLVTGVCVDQVVSFQRDAVAACAAHGGILAWINGRVRP